MEKKKYISNKQIWIGDSGASTHMTNEWSGYFQVKPENSKAVFALKHFSSHIKWAGNWRGIQQCYENGNKKGTTGERLSI